MPLVSVQVNNGQINTEAQQQLQAGKHRKAAKNFDAIIRDHAGPHPQHVHTRMLAQQHKGDALLSVRKNHEAASCYRASIKEYRALAEEGGVYRQGNPENRETHIKALAGLGEASLRAKDYIGARKAFEAAEKEISAHRISVEATGSSTSDIDQIKHQLFLGIARCNIHDGRHTDALEDLKKAYIENPTNQRDHDHNVSVTTARKNIAKNTPLMGDNGTDVLRSDIKNERRRAIIAKHRDAGKHRLHPALAGHRTALETAQDKFQTLRNKYDNTRHPGLAARALNKLAHKPSGGPTTTAMSQFAREKIQPIIEKSVNGIADTHMPELKATITQSMTQAMTDQLPAIIESITPSILAAVRIHVDVDTNTSLSQLPKVLSDRLVANISSQVETFMRTGINDGAALSDNADISELSAQFMRERGDIAQKYIKEFIKDALSDVITSGMTTTQTHVANKVNDATMSAREVLSDIATPENLAHLCAALVAVGIQAAIDYQAPG